MTVQLPSSAAVTFSWGAFGITTTHIFHVVSSIAVWFERAVRKFSGACRKMLVPVNVLPVALDGFMV
ncbi:hypothetical protein RRF57_008555 [Xylaria bambusicola]|uniref:Uncharacterized protein n=1 Tax=Xylaria bambusicola TaxID=326684 RepID=A0AAN7Z8F5_9PEZI